jgi:hypothetical protein
MEWFLDDMRFRVKRFVRFIWRAANGAVGPMFGVTTWDCESFGARGI